MTAPQNAASLCYLDCEAYPECPCGERDLYEAALRRIAHFPWNVNTSAEADLHDVKQIASEAYEEGEPETLADPIEPLSPEMVEKLREQGIKLTDWQPSAIADAEFIGACGHEEYVALRKLERAVRDLFLFPFDTNHPAEPDSEAMSTMLRRLDAIREREA